MRVGDRHNVELQSILIGLHNKPLVWKQEIKYLGIGLTLLKSNRFKFNFQNMKQKFYRALNGKFWTVGINTSPEVLCSLINTFCVPVLLYACESLNWSNKLLNSLENAYSHAFMKIFKTSDKKIVEYCYYFRFLLPCIWWIKDVYILRTVPRLFQVLWAEGKTTAWHVQISEQQKTKLDKSHWVFEKQETDALRFILLYCGV